MGDRGGWTPETGRRVIMLAAWLTPPFLFGVWLAAFLAGVPDVVQMGVFPGVFLAMLWPVDVLMIRHVFKTQGRQEEHKV